MPLHFCLQTNKQCCLLLRLTNHSSAFRPEIEHVLSCAGFWHQKYLAPEKHDRLTSFCYQFWY